MSPRAAAVAAGLIAAAATAFAAWPAPPRPTGGSPDVTFVQAMRWHHLQALDMAARIRDRTRNRTVRSLAGDIELKQSSELELMTGWLRRWGQPHGTPPGADHAHHMGMATPQDVAALSTLPPAEADQRFAALMIVHHQGALDMIRTVDRSAAHPQVRQLARTMSVTQSAELHTLRQLAVRLGARSTSQPDPDRHPAHGTR